MEEKDEEEEVGLISVALSRSLSRSLSVVSLSHELEIFWGPKKWMVLN